MSESSETIKDSTPSVTLTAGELRDMMREEIQAALGQIGHGGANGSNRHPEANKPYLTVKEAAQFACLSPSTIRLYVRKRKLKAAHVGRRVIIKRTDLERFLGSHPIETLSD